METSLTLLLWCHAAEERYRLSQEGRDWQAEFTSLELAMEYAGSLFAERASIVVTNERGDTIYVSTVEPRMKRTNAATTVYDDLKEMLTGKGLREMVRHLNSLTLQRFTSVFRFDGGMLRNVIFYDRENPEVTTCEEISIEASYCSFLRDTGLSFSVRDSTADERVRAHPKRDTVRCYCGVPILDKVGNALGSICHFDFEPGKVTEGDAALLGQVASLIHPRLAAPG